jgi:class 3 adenylate cyclase
VTTPDAQPIASPSGPDPLAAGREAAARHEWPVAHRLLTAADTAEPLGPADLELLGKASYWVGHAGESVEAYERAYAGYVAAGDRERAAFCALTLRRANGARGAGSIAAGWLKRAERILADLPDSPSHGYLAIAQGDVLHGRGDLEGGYRKFEHALEIAGTPAIRAGDPDLMAWASMRRGMVLVDMGRLDEGWPLMEEVAAAAIGGELGGYTTGAVFCNVIAMCRNMADYQRASEWADAAKRWCERQDIAGFPGVCRVHRAEVMRVLGSWVEAETEIIRACEELAEFHIPYAADAYHELGEVRLHRGDLPAAREAFAKSAEFGGDPQPGQALLLLAEGKVEAAAASIRRSVEAETWDELQRARLLPAQVEIARTIGDVETARAAADEIATIAAKFGTGALRADAERAAGIVDLLLGRPAAAAQRFRRARQLWRDLGAPYESAAAGLYLAEAYLVEGDRQSALLELESARPTFERLGASPAIEQAARLADAARSTERRPARAIRTFLFTDVVGSTALVGAIGDEAWADLRRWHDETLRTCFRDHDGEEVDHAGDGFFVAFADGRSAIDCAIEIQRRLATHRRDHGFAPRVRIGIHGAEATRDASGYSGQGVHSAARIGALAEAGEIVASALTLKGLPDVSASATREVEVKGFSEPVRIVTIDWRSPGG